MVARNRPAGLVLDSASIVDVVIGSSFRLGLVDAGIAGELPPGLALGRLAVGVDPCTFSRQAASAGPAAEVLDGFGGGNRHGHDVLRGLHERDVEQGR